MPPKIKPKPDVIPGLRLALAKRGETMAEETVEHNIDGYYSVGPIPPIHYSPTLSCSCGFVSREESWEEAGAGMDDHLEDLKR